MKRIKNRRAWWGIGDPPEWLADEIERATAQGVTAHTGAFEAMRITGLGEYRARAVTNALKRAAGDPRGLHPSQRSQAPESAPESPQAPTLDVEAPEGSDGTAGARYEHVSETGDYRFWVPGHPTAIVLSADEVSEILWQYSSEGDGLTQKRVAAAHGMTRKTLNAILRALTFTKGDLPYTDEQAADRDEDELSAELAAMMRARIDSKAHRLKWRHLEEDARKWRSLELSVLQYVREAVPTLPPVRARTIRRSPRPFALLIPVTDLHVGKRSWGGYGPGEFSTERAARRLSEAVDGALSWLPGAPERIILPIGGDFFQADSVNGTTGRGTPQDLDGTPEQMVSQGFAIAFSLVRELSAVAPVTLVYNRGNHDPILSWALFCALSHALAEDPRVDTHDDGHPGSPYQCMRYGTTAIGFHHGDGRSKPHELSAVMAQRWPEIWASTTRREWHLGHVHHLRVIEDSGVTVHTNPSLSGADRYHSLRWPIENLPQLACHAYDREIGKIATVYGVPNA